MYDQLNHEEVLKIYPWITKEFFEKCLNNDNPKVIVNDFSVKSALPKGENYGSQMIRANVTYTVDENKSESTSIVIKTDLQDVLMTELTDEMNILLKEVIAYDEILPRIYKVLLSINDDSRLSPKCYNCNTKPFYLAFEDLTINGYKNLNRRDGLNYENIKCVLVKLAKWHAASAVLMKQDSTLFKSHMAPNIEDANSNKSKYMLIMLKQTLLGCAEVIKQWNGYELIAGKLIKLAESTALHGKAVRANKINESEFNVLGHGDLWCNNIMFRETSDGIVDDAIMVDYSGGFWGSPCLDISYLFFTSSDLTVQEREWDNLIMYYYDELINNLKKLNFNGTYPTLTDINCGVVNRGFCSAITSIIGVAARKFDASDEMSITVFVGDSPQDHLMRVKILGNPICKTDLQIRLDYFHRKGYFD